MDETFSGDPPSFSIAEGENPLALLPVRPTINRGFGIMQQPEVADQAMRRSDPEASDLTRYSAFLAAETMWEIPLPFGFTIPVWSHGPTDLRVGGETPSWAEQLESVYYGQRTDTGFNFFGFVLALPEWAGGLLRTHESATLVYLYRNASGFQRDIAGMKLDFIHPGYTALIDAEFSPIRLNTFTEKPWRAFSGHGSFVSAMPFSSLRKRRFLWREDDDVTDL
jgi:hypothetical protein